MGNCMKSSTDIKAAGGNSATTPAPGASNSSEPIEFGYWGVKGFGEVTRWVIHYLGLKVKEWNPASKEDWGKSQIGRGEFPNLPYIKDGGFYISETYAVHSYLAIKVGKPDLLGKNLADKALVRTIEGVTSDVKAGFFKTFPSPDKKEVLRKSLASDGELGKKLDQISKFLGSKDYFLGYITVADIEFAYIATFLEVYAVSLELESPLKDNIKKHVHNIRQLPGIKERIASSKDVPFMAPGSLPFNFLTSGQLDEKLKQ